MKKTIAAVAAGLLLVAGQAVAQTSGFTVRVGDRVGAEAGESSYYQPKYIVKADTAIWVAAVTVGVFAVVVLDRSESD